MSVVDNYDVQGKGFTYVDACTPSPSLDLSKKHSESDVFNEELIHESTNPLLLTEFKFTRENKKYGKKIKKIRSILSNKPVNLEKLKESAVSEGGLVNDEIRKIAWPHLLEVSDVKVLEFADKKQFENHPEYQQVVLDVNRSLKRFPPGIPLEQRLALQNQLTHLILKVVTTHPCLRYYQGYHDVAVTLLLVTGLDAAYHILEKLSTNHLKDCMEPTMEKTSHLLNYIFPLVRCQNKDVYEHLENSGVGTMFALPWFLTWFSHSLNHYEDVVRLFDYFLATEPLRPLYLSAVIIAFRHKDILETPCDMANLHFLLSQLPDDLPFDLLLLKTTKLYEEHPPESIHREATARTQKEEELRKKEYATRRQRRNQNMSFIWRMFNRVEPGQRTPWPFGYSHRLAHGFSRYGYLIATATFAVGLYAVYLKAVEAVNVSEER